ncbi:MAG: hypothetical protein QG600_415 [Patescibacteria group bacterium]|jgi:Cof subfamily protein (haloacid dehalogenase superfamily)|nr:hypothetical protein [Patescibacteria group bacterium]
MKYKALFLDCDGTLIPYDYAALPSDALARAIKKAEEKVAVCIVTGRAYPFTKPILEKLGLHSGILVANNGAEVIDLKTGGTLYEKPIEEKDFRVIADYLNKENISFYAKQDQKDLSYQEKHFSSSSGIKKVFMGFTEEILSLEKAENILKFLSSLPTINAHKTHHADPDKYGIIFSHAQATKMHGVSILLKELNLKKEEVIGVGDSYNDFPLLMASGLKVAMGNAVEELKEIADYIAPSVTEDGVVDVIEKFILTPTP